MQSNKKVIKNDEHYLPCNKKCGPEMQHNKNNAIEKMVSITCSTSICGGRNEITSGMIYTQVSLV